MVLSFEARFQIRGSENRNYKGNEIYGLFAFSARRTFKQVCVTLAAHNSLVLRMSIHCATAAEQVHTA